jgi:hypothetical protein
MPFAHMARSLDRIILPDRFPRPDSNQIWSRHPYQRQYGKADLSTYPSLLPAKLPFQDKFKEIFWHRRPRAGKHRCK